MESFQYSNLLKIFFSTFFLLSLSHTIQAQSISEEWTLQDCIQYALDNNIQIQQAELGLKEAEIDKSDALGNYLPNVSAGASNSWNSGLTQNVTSGILEQQTTRNFSFNATTSIAIFHGLQNLKEWQRSKMTELSSQYALDQMRDDVLLNVTNAYLNIIVNQERLTVLEEQNELTKAQLRRIRIMIEEGAAPSGDSLDIKATDANEQQQIINAKNDIRLGNIHLAQLLQLDDYSNFKVADISYNIPIETLLSKTPEEIIANAKENRAEIKIAEQDLKLAEKDVEIARSGFYPRLDGYINFNTRESGMKRAVQGDIDPNNPYRVIGQVEGTGANVITPNYLVNEIGPRPFFKQLSQNKGWDFGLRLTIPILNGFQTRNSVRRRQIDIERREIALKQANLDLESNVYQAYVDAQGAAEAYQAAQVSVNAQQKAFEYSQDKYDVGKITSFEFSQAKFDLTDAESQLINSKYDYIFKLKVLELYFGIEPEDIQLN
ncbi:MAG TPA: TolC family protein [Flavobacteriaceae bacterium]|nr:TolC family protein [Flavobacteriaceae bacterium]